MKHLYIISSPPKEESPWQGLIFSCILMLVSRDLLGSSMLALTEPVYYLVVLQKSDETLSF